MKTKSRILCIAVLMICMQSQAQFFKKLGERASKAAEETVLNKIDEKTTRTTGKTMDTIFDAGTKSKKKKPSGKRTSPSKKNEDKSDKTTNRNVKSAKDFVPGNKAIYTDNFSNDAIGDFPVTWNTNASAEVVTFEGEDTRWLQMANNGAFTPDGITAIPENSTLEFDLYVSDNYSYFDSGIFINLVEITEKNKDFMQWTQYTEGKNGIRLWLHPTDVLDPRDRGRSAIYTFVNGAKILDNSKTLNQFTLDSRLIHVSIWRQKSRLRVYLNDKKIWDLPRAFDTPNYNSVTFNVGKGQDDKNFYVANLRLAVAGEDTRHALLETGEFETNEILFDTGKASIQKSSSPILKEIGELLQENQNLKIKIIGHTDSDGQADTNQTLSEARAKSVKEYLTDNFPIMGNRLQTMGEGASKPVASNDSEENKRKNRRVQFIKVE